MNLHFVRDYDAPPAAVWRALTDPALLARWYMEAHDLELTVGSSFRLHDPNAKGWSGELQCTVLEVVNEQRFAYRSLEPKDALTTEVAWTLEPHGTGTRLTLDHTGFTGVKGRLTGLLLRFGWKGLLRDSLPKALVTSGKP
jgi:uncharacterized protein YndB with AHSA1/START domain